MNCTIARISEQASLANLALRQCFIYLVAVGFFALGPSTSLAVTHHTVKNDGDLHELLAGTELKSGDVVVLENGIYEGKFEVKTDGITIRAKNRHAAILRGTSNSLPKRCDVPATQEAKKNVGLRVSASRVKIEDLRFEEHYVAVWGSDANGLSFATTTSSTSSATACAYRLVTVASIQQRHRAQSAEDSRRPWH